MAAFGHAHVSHKTLSPTPRNLPRRFRELDHVPIDEHLRKIHRMQHPPLHQHHLKLLNQKARQLKRLADNTKRRGSLPLPRCVLVYVQKYTGQPSFGYGEALVCTTSPNTNPWQSEQCGL
eukprot:6451297-Amphidinium_carterae.1